MSKIIETCKYSSGEQLARYLAATRIQMDTPLFSDPMTIEQAYQILDARIEAARRDGGEL
jgi:hypothetical protein